MTTVQPITPIVEAAQQDTVLKAALAYQAMGLSVLPLKGKRPVCFDWKQYQMKPATAETIQRWHQNNLLENVGIVCGSVSNNLVVLDLDGASGYPAFAAQFPELAKTYTIATGGGVGKHVYWQVEQVPEAIKAMNTPIGHLEICANGRQIVAPPSKHPKTGQLYRIEKADPILKVSDLKDLVAWGASFKPKPVTLSFPRNHQAPTQDATINRDVVRAIESHFISRGYKPQREWLHGTCIYPNRHKNGDRHPSFGFNTHSAYGFCHVCGTMLAKDICEAIGINPDNYGGLVEKPIHVVHQSSSSVKLSDAPPADNPPPDAPSQLLSIDDLKLPNWLKQYLDWAGTTGNETPMNFHLGAGLWLLSIAIGRRLYAQAPWGIKIFPNLYLMMIGDTTFFRKSTAYKLAEQIAREAIPHMLMPTPGSPERFQEALSGRLPANFKDLSATQKERIKKAQPFAAQRGLLKDEVAGLFGAINRKDYMVGMRDLLMELYDCPQYSDKDTQSGLTIVENAALSILGVTTPASLSNAVSDSDWSNGLLIRFGLLTPEQNYKERPALEFFQQPPQSLVDDLRTLHERLPQAEANEDGFDPIPAIEFEVQCWAECRAYGARLRKRCDPRRDDELDERLKGVYGRMHVQALKLAQLFGALEWLEQDTEKPVITLEHWRSAQAIADMWLQSAHQLIATLDMDNHARQEQQLQRRILEAFHRAGAQGEKLHTIYKNLHVSAKKARHNTDELVKAGLLLPIQIGRSEAYLHKDFIGDDG